jgi:hypothetical protein
MKKFFVIAALSVICGYLSGQTVPMGMHYQAVARDNQGNELVNTRISVRFSILSGDPAGPVAFQEIHSNIFTSKYGVFSLIIGHGTPTKDSPVQTITEVAWKNANFYLRVEVQFEGENDYRDMGTMQFLTVPYAYYAFKSLEPGPQGPKGDQGDPASDDQTLSFDGKNLTIAGGNTVNISSLNVPHQLTLIGDTLSIYGGNKVGLTNAIQDLQLDINNKLKITKNPNATSIDLSPFKQNLSYNSSTGMLALSNGTGADLSSLKTDAIQDIHLSGDLLTIDKNASSTGVDLSKYNQHLNYNESTKSLSIDRGNSVTLGTMVAFRAKNTSSDISAIASYPTMTYDAVEYNVGNNFDPATGIFTSPVDGIYTFNVSYYADGSGSGRELDIYVNSVLYEKLAVEIGAGTTVPVKSVTMKLSASNTVNVVVYTGLATQTGTGTFSGYKVY